MIFFQNGLSTDHPPPYPNNTKFGISTKIFATYYISTPSLVLTSSNHTLEFYIPVGELSTWAFHASRSDAVVTEEGPTDRATLLQPIGLTCTAGDTECEEIQEDLINQFTDMNKNGTSTGLGGLDRLRSYGAGRFSRAHTQYFSTEFRLNLTEELSPFNFSIWKDIRTDVKNTKPRYAV